MAAGLRARPGPCTCRTKLQRLSSTPQLYRPEQHQQLPQAWPAPLHAAAAHRWAAGSGRSRRPRAAAAASTLAPCDDEASTSDCAHEVLPTFVAPTNRPTCYNAAGKLMLKNLTLPELEAWCASLGEPPKRAMQIWRWMYQDGFWVSDLGETFGKQNGLSQKFLDVASPHCTAEGGLELQRVVRASDGTRKLLFKLTTGEAAGGTVEAVIIPVVRQQGLRDRLTLCVSSQVGCAMNCQFCYTGRMGLLGNLSTAQIVEQVVQARRILAQDGDKTPLTNLVFMGMGEPLHNMEAVLAATDIMCDHLGLHMSHNKVTISTVGLLPEMREVLKRSRAQLALSLHATTDEVRNWIVPVGRRYGLATLAETLRELMPRDDPDGRSLLVEYVMLRGINDTAEDAVRLVELLQGVKAKVNLITFNPHAGTLFQPSEEATVLAFRSAVIQGGLVCTIRDSRGDDEMAACGQLGDVGVEPPRRAPILEPPPRFRGLLAGAGAGVVGAAEPA